MTAAADNVAAEIPLRGTSLIEAGAGTGKTHAIVDLYVRMLLERKLSVSQILVVTYTVAATAELRDRIRRRLVSLASRGGGEGGGEGGGDGEDARRCREAVRSFDRAAIFSIHGFCQRALAEHAFESGASFESELVSDSRSLLEEVAQDFWSRALHGASRVQVAHAIHEGVVPSRLAELAGRLAARPDAELRPPRPEGFELDAALADWHSAWARASALWGSGGGDVIELIASAAERGELYKASYQPKVVRTAWRIAMDELMRSGEPGLHRRFDKVERLTSSGLRVKKRCPRPEHPFFDACEALLRADDSVGAALADWAAGLRHDFADYARRELTRRKRERDVLFFDDLLQGLRDALAEEGGESLAAALRRRHRVALIDEFQDTDPIQYEIFRRVWHAPEAPEEPALVLIGDPKQAIYAFRGADVQAYLEARADAASVHGLVRNRRADPGLVAGLNALFGSREEPFARREIPFEPALPRSDARDLLRGDRIATGLRFLLAPSEDGAEAVDTADFARAVACEVARILAGRHEIDGRPLTPGDVAVLTRTNRQARDVQVALREYGVVSVLQSEESVFATQEARELERVLRAMSEPERASRLRAALATPLFGAGAEELEAAEDEASGELFDLWSERLRAGRRIWTERGSLQALRFLWVECGVGARLLERADGERRVTNLLHLGELLQRAEVEERFGPQALLYWLARRRAEAERATSTLAEDAQLRLESDAHAVQLLTVHRSKGLQFPVTLCPWLWDGTRVPRGETVLRYHDRETGALVLEALRRGEESEPGRELAGLEAHEENLRLVYVALTRAKHHCSVVWGRFKNAEDSPLAHLLHRPAFGSLKERSDAQLRADLEQLAARSGGAIAIEAWQPRPGPVARPLAAAAGPAAPRLEARRAKRSHDGRWRVSSFSGLVASARAPGSVAWERRSAEMPAPVPDDARDYDGVAAAADETSAAGGGDVRLADFPAGTLPGIAIHEILQRLDFPEALEADADALAARVAPQLERRGLSPRFAPSLAAALREVLAVPLLPGQPDSQLGAVGRRDRIDEMEFVLPVAARGADALPLTARALGRAFAEHATAPAVRRYAERAAALGFPALEGILRGFIDLVFRRGGRFSLVDYKSNRLGPSQEDYAPDALERAMLEHDYVLQYHLYLVALHRHLCLRAPGYDYERDVEGAFYLFVRGMSPAHPPSWGVYRDRPPRALIEALSECLS